MSILKSKSAFNILLAVDDLDHSEVTTALLTHISWPLETVVHILAFVPDRLPDLNPDPEAAIDEKLALDRWRGWARANLLAAETAAKLRAHHLAVKTEICEGQLPEVMLARAADLSIDLMAMDPAKFKTLAEFRPNYPLSRSPRQKTHSSSLLVARASRQIRPLNTILVIEHSVEARRAVEFMCSLSLPHWAKITVGNVAKEPAAGFGALELAGPQYFSGRGGAVLDLPDPVTAEVIDRLQRSGSRVWRSSFHFREPVDEILATAWEQAADLIVIGVHHQIHHQPFYLDDIAQEIIQHAPCSVLAIC